MRAGRPLIGVAILARLTRLCLFTSALVAGLSAGSAEAASYKVGSFIKTTAGAPASQTVAHGLAVIPKALILWTDGKTNEAFSSDSLFAFGTTDGTTSASSATGAQDAAAPTYASNRIANKVLTLVQGGGATLAEADLTSWDATNFTLNWMTNDGNPYVIHFIAIGGSSVSAKVVLWNAPLATGNLAVNTVGFQPDVVIHSMTQQVTSPATGGEGAFVLGVSAGTGANQWSNSIHSSGGSPSTTQRAQSTASSLYWVRAGAIARQATFVSMNALGFTLNHTTVDPVNAHQVFSLALRGIQVRAGSFIKSTAAAPIVQTVGALTLQPRVVLLSSVQNVTAAGAVAEARYGIGASDGTSEGSSAFQDQNAQATSNVDGIDKTSKAFVKVNNATPTVNAEADMLGFGENSFILDWTTNDAVATQMLYLALGDVTTYYRSIGTAANYAQGNVTVTRGSKTVTGGGGPPPDWVTANRGRGDRITITGQGTFTIAGVVSPASLVLTSPFTGTSGTYTYSIARNFTGPEAWYDCVDGTTACTPAGGANLVTTRRKEVGVMYKEGHAAWTGPIWDTAITSATYDITLTADPGNRHLGVFGAGAIFNGGGSSIRPYNSYMTFEWLEFRNGSPRIFHISNIGSPNKLTVRYSLFHSSATQPLVWFSGSHDADVYNNVFHANDGIDIDLNSTVNIYNNTFYNLTSNAVVSTAGSTVTLRNNIAHTCGGPCFNVPGRTAASSNNLSSDGTATSVNPGGDSPLWNNVPLGAISFVNAAAGNLHINSGSRAQNGGANLSGLFTNDIDDLARPTAWDIGADEVSADLAITKDDGQATAVVGGPISYTITVTNLGPSGVTGATVTDTLPASLTGASWNCAASPGSSCASSGSGNISDTISLLVGGTATYTLTATIDPAATSPLDNTATVAPPADVIDPDPTNNADTDSDALIAPADLMVMKTGPATALLGQTIVYSVTAKNNGPANTSGVTLVDTLPPDVEFLSSMPAGPDCNYSAASHRLTCTIPSLAPSSTFPVSISVRVVSPGSIVNLASVSGPDPDIPGNNAVTFTTDVGVPSDEVQFFTVTSRKGENVLEWLYPALSYNTVRIVYNTGITSCAYPVDPMGGDGTILLPPPPPGAVNGHDSYRHAGLMDGHEYCYTIFVDTGGGNYSVGRSNRGRPFDTSCGSCFTKWAYSVGNTSMAPPGIGVDTVHAVANDNALHSMRKAGRFEEGTWPSGWRPKDTGGPSQGRPTTINIPTGSAARVIFLGSQNGNVYAIDADAGGPGHEWATPLATLWGLGTRVQATPSGVFTGFGGSRDYVLVGTRRPAEDNAFYALDRATGNPVGPPWPFTGTGPADKIGVINFQASVDYGNHLVYFTSFARGGGLGNNTVWCLDFWTMGVVWAKAYANVTTSPIASGNRVYVGTATGEVLALRTSDGGLDWSEATGDGPVKGFVMVERVTGDVYFSTTTAVHARRADGSVKWDKPHVSPSTPVILAGRSRVYVGTGDGLLHGLNELDGGDEPFFPIQMGDGAAAVGSVTIDAREGHLYVGTEAGIIYAVQIP